MFIFIFTCVIIIFITYRNFGWLISRIIASSCGCTSVRFGRCGFFYVTHFKMCFRNGVTVEVNDLRLSSSFVNSQYTKPLMVMIDDVRFEGERKQVIVGSDAVRKNSTSLITYKKRILNWLQYVGAIVHTTNIVYLEAIPECFLHTTFELLQLDGYRDLDRMQLKLNCRLVQAKVFSRARSERNSSLLELSLRSVLSVNFAFISAEPEDIVLSISNPLLCISDALLNYYYVHSPWSKNRSSSNSRSQQSVHFIRWLCGHFKLNVDNIEIRYAAAKDAESIRHISAVVGSITSKMDHKKSFLVSLSTISVDDTAKRSTFKCDGFGCRFPVDIFNQVEGSVEVHVFSPFLLISEDDLSWWAEYVCLMDRRITAVKRFADDFSPSVEGIRANK
ncbi:hypothetical protein AB6A40_010189 [Gnathostoma spinigerum]|uniref:Uncharacterized protein n=1 Tax=Gnathostoma spinigerum TaxID=75299 RepID=A0ABD6EU31_9BILA